MQLILWRHADAEDGADDLRRKLTAKGRHQAERVAKWLTRHLPRHYEVISSPADRARQTAEALGVPFRISNALAPGAAIPEILKTADWPDAKGVMIIVGHQPDLGRAAAHLVAGRHADWHIAKGGFWWLAHSDPVTVKAVLSPELL
jgi:phosphohistidine phosphatase